MDKIIINSIELENFKGIKHIKVDFNNSANIIAAECGAGKTTLYDGYKWCLGVATRDFEPINGNSVVDNVTILARVEFTLKSFNFALIRRAVRKNGRMTTKITLNDYEFTSQRQYEDRMESLFGIPFDMLALLIDTNGFTALPGEKQRDILFRICDMSSKIDEIIENNNFEWIKEQLANGETEITMQKGLTQLKTEINRKLDIENAIIDNNENIKAIVRQETDGKWEKYAELSENRDSLIKQIGGLEAINGIVCPYCNQVITYENNADEIKQRQEMVDKITDEMADLDRITSQTAIFPLLEKINATCKSKIKDCAINEQSRLAHNTELEQFIEAENNYAIEMLNKMFDEKITFIFDEKSKQNSIKTGCIVIYKGFISYANASYGQKIAINYHIGVSLRKIFNLDFPIWVDDYGSTIPIEPTSQFIGLITDNSRKLQCEKIF